MTPAALFGAPMGMFALGLAWREATQAFGVPALLAEAILLLAGLALGAQTAAYGWKLLRRPEAARGDFFHPVQSSFFGAAAIDLTLLGAALAPYAAESARLVWSLGAVLQLVVAARTVLWWIARPPGWAAVNPTWLIPTVGTLVVPATASLGGPPALAWIAALVGGASTAIVLPVVLWRLVQRGAPPPALLPTIAITMTPPALCALTWDALLGTATDPAALAILTAGYVALVGVAWQLPQLARAPFASSWWAYTFPLANLTLASFRLRAELGGALLLLTTAVVTLVAALTMNGLAQGQIERG
jgi:tellurite resistance protein